MPRLTATPLLTSAGLQLRRVACDGVDAPRPVEEGTEDPRLIVVLHGRFIFQDATTRVVASPATGLLLPGGQPYRIRHVHGEGDTCLAVQGDVCRTLAESGPIVRRLSVEDYLRISALARGIATGAFDTAIAVEEVLYSVFAPAGPQSGGTSRARAIAEAIAYDIERHVDDLLSLTALARNAGTSLFHACRVFKRTFGTTIHQYHLELRLRHALALLLDTDRPLARIATDAGFANQAHLANLFRRRFHTTPGTVRKGDWLPDLRPR